MSGKFDRLDSIQRRALRGDLPPEKPTVPGGNRIGELDKRFLEIIEALKLPGAYDRQIRHELNIELSWIRAELKRIRLK